MRTEAACQALCRAESDCKFYTWFNTDNRVFFNYCFLFSSCDKVGGWDLLSRAAPNLPPPPGFL